MEEKVVVYSGSRNLYPVMETIVKSLLYYNKIDAVWLLIEDDVFPFDMPDCVHTMNLSGQKYFPPRSANMRTRYSYMVLMRAVLADLFPQYDKVLSLDTDTIIEDDISGLWDLPLDDCYFAAAEEPTCVKGGKHGRKDPRYYSGQDRYYNAGVMLYNLKKMREDGIWQKNVELLRDEEFYSVDQDTMNMTCSPHIYHLEPVWNSSIWTKVVDNPKITHFAENDLVDWWNLPLTYKWRNMTWKEVMTANAALGKNRKAARKPKEREKRVVVYAATRNLYSELNAAVKSLLIHTEIDEVWCLLEDDVFPYKVPTDRVKVMNVKDQEWFPPSCPNAQTKLTYMVLMRAVYSKLFLDYDKVLQIDVDTIVNDDIGGLWDYDLDDYYFGACLEPECSKGGLFYKRDKYFQMGVAMLNLKKLRDGTDDIIIKKIQSGLTEKQEQGVFNEVCEGKILEISPRYNASDWTAKVKHARITHFAAVPYEQWCNSISVQRYKDIPWKEVDERKLWEGTL